MLIVRPGDAGQAQGTWEPDGMTTSGGPQDVWFDHCSFTWAVALAMAMAELIMFNPAG